MIVLWRRENRVQKEEPLAVADTNRVNFWRREDAECIMNMSSGREEKTRGMKMCCLLLLVLRQPP